MTEKMLKRIEIKNTDRKFRVISCREEHPACKKLSDEVLAWFLVLAYSDCPAGKEAVKRMLLLLLL